MKKTTAIFFFISILFTPGFSQERKFSFSTDASLLHSFRKDQRYWAFGQTITAQLYFSPTDAWYGWFAYYGNGRFTNRLTALATDTAAIPQAIQYLNYAAMKYQHLSTGWKHYFTGSYFAEENLSLYGYAGFGLMFGNVMNKHSISLDTSLYELPVLSGKASFKRLTIDLGLGIEKPLGGDIYAYFEGRAIVPTTEFPSRHLLVNRNAPFTGSFNTGLRLLFY